VAPRGAEVAAAVCCAAVCAVVLTAAAAAPAQAAQDSDETPGRHVPAALRALVPAGQELLAWQRADLNLDGRPDMVFVLQPLGSTAYDTERGDAQRPLRVALADARGRLRVVAGNDTLVMCHNCGGTWPEPFDSLVAEAGRFTISHYGGSRWRWSDSYRFDYDAQAKTWLLSAAQSGADTADNGHQVRTYVRGRHFGSHRLSRLDRESFWQRRTRPGVPEPRPVRDPSRS